MIIIRSINWCNGWHVSLRSRPMPAVLQESNLKISFDALNAKKKIFQLGSEKPLVAPLSIRLITIQRSEWPPFLDRMVSTTLTQTWMTWKQMVITWFGAGRYFLNFDNHCSSAKKQSDIDETRAQILKTMKGLQMFCLSHLYNASLAEWVFSFECLEVDFWSAKILFVWR